MAGFSDELMDVLRVIVSDKKAMERAEQLRELAQAAQKEQAALRNLERERANEDRDLSDREAALASRLKNIEGREASTKRLETRLAEQAVIRADHEKDLLARSKAIDTLEAETKRAAEAVAAERRDLDELSATLAERERALNKRIDALNHAISDRS